MRMKTNRNKIVSFAADFKKEYEKPEVILKRVIEMEDEIQQKLKGLEEMM